MIIGRDAKARSRNLRSLATRPDRSEAVFIIIFDPFDMVGSLEAVHEPGLSAQPAMGVTCHLERHPGNQRVLASSSTAPAALALACQAGVGCCRRVPRTAGCVEATSDSREDEWAQNRYSLT